MIVICPLCGEKMEKGGVATIRSEKIMWFCDETIEKYSEFPKSLLTKCDMLLDGKSYKIGGYYGYMAYRCKKCGATLIITDGNV